MRPFSSLALFIFAFALVQSQLVLPQVNNVNDLISSLSQVQVARPFSSSMKVSILLGICQSTRCDPLLRSFAIVERQSPSASLESTRSEHPETTTTSTNPTVSRFQTTDSL